MSADDIKKKVDESWKDKAKTEPKDIPEPPQDFEPDFKFFLTTLGMQAWIALGIIENPSNNQREENLPQAKFLIDVLGVLETKTKNNCDKDETHLLETLLHDLRLAYVEKSSTVNPSTHPGH
jgi:hypothetical protein